MAKPNSVFRAVQCSAREWKVYVHTYTASRLQHHLVGSSHHVHKAAVESNRHIHLLHQQQAASFIQVAVCPALQG